MSWTWDKIRIDWVQVISLSGWRVISSGTVSMGWEGVRGADRVISEILSPWKAYVIDRCNCDTLTCNNSICSDLVSLEVSNSGSLKIYCWPFTDCHITFCLLISLTCICSVLTSRIFFAYWICFSLAWLVTCCRFLVSTVAWSTTRVACWLASVSMLAS